MPTATVDTSPSAQYGVGIDLLTDGTTTCADGKACRQHITNDRLAILARIFSKRKFQFFFVSHMKPF
jgi:hypothetical protein